MPVAARLRVIAHRQIVLEQEALKQQEITQANLYRIYLST